VEGYVLDHHQMVETAAEKVIIFIGSCHIIIIMELKMLHICHEFTKNADTATLMTESQR